MKAQHTPFPWTLKKCNCGDPICDRYRVPKVIDSSGLLSKEDGELIISLPLISHHTNELLAILHGDGGHYSLEHGLIKAIEDAKELIHTKWVKNEHLTDINELSKERDELKKWKEDTIKTNAWGKISDWVYKNEKFIEIGPGDLISDKVIAALEEFKVFKTTDF